ncbi:hypothetical protein OAF99_02815 [Akkermansiaceae bacterium]|nr:hypothetical protein [Akkermansiaceae bacterium]
MKNWVKAIEISDWSETAESMFYLPALVRRLIHATATSINSINFPAGKDVVRQGFDGVTAANGLRWVPDGKCYWEVSVREDVLKKANEDHSKRIDQVVPIERKNSTYVCLTTRRWPDKQKSRHKWEEEQKQAGGWGAVRILDAGSLEEWLEIAPAVSVWFARLVGLIGSAEDYLDIDYQWASRTSGLSSPPLSAQFFLEGRKSQQDRICEFYLGVEQEIYVESDDREECIDFLAATYAELDEDDKSAVGAKLLVVETQSAFRKLVRLGMPLILVQGGSLLIEPGDIAEALHAGHRVIHTSGKTRGQGNLTIRFSRRTSHEIEERLKASKYEDERARIFGLDSNGRVSVLKRLLRPGSSRPGWARTDSSELIPALLIGSWFDENEGDQAVISLLTDSGYDVLASKLQRLRLLGEAPLELGKTHWRGGPDERWAWQSRAEAWSIVAPLLRRSDYEQFQMVAELVLGEKNPRYDLPESERVYSEITGHKLETSSELREGVANGLALMGGRADQTRDPGKSRAVAAASVRAILKDAPWKIWASLSSQLPLLAEASPESFLESVESAFEQGGESLRLLFVESDGSLLGGSTPHTGLLWALEGLAWHPDYFNRAVLLLAQLASIDPGGKTSNRPLNSLSEIFAGWINNTTVGNEAKVAALKLICNSCPYIGYELHCQIMPSSHQCSMGAHKPRWRSWLVGFSRHPLVVDYHAYTEEIFESFLGLSRGNPDRLVRVVDCYDCRRGISQLAAIRDLLTSEKIASWEESEKESVSTAIRRVVNRHRFFRSAEWALAESEIASLEEIRARYEPKDLKSQSRWLFDCKRFDLYSIGREEMDHQEQEAMVKGMKQSALVKIFEREGVGGVEKFAKMVKDEFAIGILLAELKLEAVESEILPAGISDSEIDKFSEGFLRGAIFSDPWEWVEGEKIEGWNDAALGHFAANCPFEERTWDWLKDLSPSIEDHYWSVVDGWSGNLSSDELERAIRELLRKGRPGIVVSMLNTALHQKQTFRPELVIEALETLLKFQDQVSDDHALCCLFSHLQSASGIDQMKLGQLEWAYLRVLDPYQGGYARALQHSLANDASFFVEVLSIVYRSKNEPKRDLADFSDDERNQAELAGKLLENWQSCPCSDDEGEVDGVALTEYVRKIQEFARKGGRLDIAMLTLGNKFAHSKESEGLWPPAPVCEVIQTIPGEDVIRGFQTAVRNKRGVHTWTGGAEEMEISEGFREQAERVDAKWPRVASALREISNDYKSQSQRAAEVIPYSD